VGIFLLSCSLGTPLTAQEPDVAQARRKELEAERDKLAQRLGEIDAALAKLKPAVKPGEPVVIEGFLGISSDFSVYAAWNVDSVAFMELDTNKRLPAPPWETDWGLPRDVLFGANFVAVHANGLPIKRGFSGSPSISVKIFSRKTLEMERNFRGPITDESVAGGNVLALLIDYDGERGKRLVLHDIKAKKQVAHIGLDQNYVYSLADGGKYFAFGGRHFSGKKGDGQVTILNAETGKVTAAVTITLVAKMLPRQLPVAVSADGARLAWADDDVAILYDVKTAKVLHRLEGHLDAVDAMTYSPSGDFLVTSAKDKTVRFWSTATGKSVHTIKNLPAAVSAIVLAPDGKRILTVSGNSRDPADVRGEIRNFDLK
jgi:hypothetical protein